MSRTTIGSWAMPLVLFLSGLLTACGGSSSRTSPPPPPPPPTITSVTVTSNQSVVPVGQQAVFDATLKGTGQFNASVTWSVNGVNGGDTADGTIAGGLYTAPATLPKTNPVTVAATSVLHRHGNGFCGDYKYSEAQASYDRALQLNPKSFNAYFDRGLLFEKEGKMEEALADDRKSVSLQPTVQGYLQLSRTFQKLNRIDEAKDSYWKARESRIRSEFRSLEDCYA